MAKKSKPASATDNSSDNTSGELLVGLPPLTPTQAEAQPTILILGSMPSVSSLNHAQYYAHPRNHFWAIMEALFQVPQSSEYTARQSLLAQQGVVVWDVIGQCQRRGSLDSAIIPASVIPNDIETLLQQLPSITHIGCNGGTAYKTLKRYFPTLLHQYHCVTLLSSSPANAKYTLAEKIQQWRTQLPLIDKAKH